MGGTRTPSSSEPEKGTRLLVDVVLRFQPLQQWLEKLFRLVGSSADGHRHFLRGVREITGVRRDSCQRQVADPVIRILLGNLRIQLKSALGVTRSLQASSVRVELNRAGFIERLGKRSEEHTSELQSLAYLVCRLLLEKKKNI